MNELLREISAEKEHISDTLRALDEAIKRTDRTIVELAAIATFLQNTYNGMENLLKRILKSKNISVPASESFHKDLLDLSVDNQVISVEFSRKLDQYRAFRHFHVHGYGIMLDEEQLMPLAENLRNVWTQFESEISSLAHK
jgi:uncharacterized protein YutE (UPF0331/DUF86 family)